MLTKSDKRMKKIICNYRYWVLIVLGTIAMVGIMAVPADELPITSWVYVLVSSKLIAVAAGYVFHRLYLRWEKRGTIAELTDFITNY